MATLTHHILMRMEQLEADICLSFNRICHRTWWARFFSAVSWLGDGKFWYWLMAVLAVTYGETGLMAAGHMLVAGLVSLFIYRWLKKGTARPRPYQVHKDILLGTRPLDPFSFPSGHTLHAVGFTWIACFWFPELAVALIPFTLLVAASRMILGLHYPSDVLAGAAIGTLVAGSSLLLI